MRAMDYLKAQLNDFVDSYSNYFWKTLGVAFLFTVFCFLAPAYIIVHYYPYDKATGIASSIFSLFFHRFSTSTEYYLPDLTKTLMLFLVSIYSISLVRWKSTEPKEFSLGNLFKRIKLMDLVVLTFVFALCSYLDYFLTTIDPFLSMSQHTRAERYYHNLLFHVRIYLPLFAYAFTIRSLTGVTNRITLKRILFLYFALWLCNEFAYELSLWFREYIFNLILIGANSDEKIFLWESFLGIPLIASLFPLYYSAMVTPLRFAPNKKSDSDESVGSSQ